MTHDDFEKFVQETIFPRIFNTVVTKGREYETSENRFGNFLRLAEFNKVRPVTIIQSLVSKHILSLRDMIHELETVDAEQDLEVYEEKIFDILTYHCIMYGMLVEEANWKPMTATEVASRQEFIHPHCPSCGVIEGAKHIEGCSATKDYTAHVTRQDIVLEPENCGKVTESEVHDLVWYNSKNGSGLRRNCDTHGCDGHIHDADEYFYTTLPNGTTQRACCKCYNKVIAPETKTGWVKRINKGIHRMQCVSIGCSRSIGPSDEFYELGLDDDEAPFNTICCACHDKLEAEENGD